MMKWSVKLIRRWALSIATNHTFAGDRYYPNRGSFIWLQRNRRAFIIYNVIMENRSTIDECWEFRLNGVLYAYEDIGNFSILPNISFLLAFTSSGQITV